WDLESIARKCLDPDPARRYQQGEHLAEDLRRFQENLPLKYAPELSRVERVRKFFRRNPRLRGYAAISTAAMAAVAIFGFALAAARGNLAEARSRLGVASARERKRAHDQGMTKALCLVNTTLGLEDHLRQGIAVCERTLDLFGAPGTGRLEDHPSLR